MMRRYHGEGCATMREPLRKTTSPSFCGLNQYVVVCPADTTTCRHCNASVQICPPSGGERSAGGPLSGGWLNFGAVTGLAYML